jgi:peptidyl-tRNA hydrolase
MKITTYYRRNLKMSEGKLAAQVAHCVANIALAQNEVPEIVVVLKASDKKFEELKEKAEYVQVDLGFTELDPNTETVLGIMVR